MQGESISRMFIFIIFSNFLSLFKELHIAFKPHKFVLTAAVAAGIKYIKTGYELTEIYKYIRIFLDKKFASI